MLGYLPQGGVDPMGSMLHLGRHAVLQPVLEHRGERMVGNGEQGLEVAVAELIRDGGVFL